MVDIYDIVPQDKVPQPAPGPYAYAGQDARMARYHTLLSKLSSHDDLASVAQIDWGLPDDDTLEMQQSTAPLVKPDGAEALVGNFSDAAAAMR